MVESGSPPSNDGHSQYELIGKSIAISADFNQLSESMENTDSMIIKILLFGSFIATILGIAKPGEMMYVYIKKLINQAAVKLAETEMNEQVEILVHGVVGFLSQFSVNHFWTRAKESAFCLEKNMIEDSCEGPINNWIQYYKQSVCSSNDTNIDSDDIGPTGSSWCEVCFNISPFIGITIVVGVLYAFVHSHEFGGSDPPDNPSPNITPDDPTNNSPPNPQPDPPNDPPNDPPADPPNPSSDNNDPPPKNGTDINNKNSKTDNPEPVKDKSSTSDATRSKTDPKKPTRKNDSKKTTTKIDPKKSPTKIPPNTRNIISSDPPKIDAKPSDTPIPSNKDTGIGGGTKRKSVEDNNARPPKMPKIQLANTFCPNCDTRSVVYHPNPLPIKCPKCGGGGDGKSAVNSSTSAPDVGQKNLVKDSFNQNQRCRTENCLQSSNQYTGGHVPMCADLVSSFIPSRNVPGQEDNARPNEPRPNRKNCNNRRYGMNGGGGDDKDPTNNYLNELIYSEACAVIEMIKERVCDECQDRLENYMDLMSLEVFGDPKDKLRCNECGKCHIPDKRKLVCRHCHTRHSRHDKADDQ